jgi:hypothetical protein
VRLVSTLTFIEKRTLEKYLDMGGGYVLTFSNRTMQEFFADTVRRDCYDEKYGRGSKASIMRSFWQQESDPLVAKVLNALVELKGTSDGDPEHDAVVRIVERLRSGGEVEDLEALDASVNGRDFEALTKSVREAIEKDEPESGLDRLHTFTIKYMRLLCARYGIVTDKDKPLHSLMGEYVKKRPPLESEMSERILKSTISIFQSFNDVRNDRSLAHDNPLLARSEAYLIVGHILGVIRFLSTIESIEPNAASAAAEDWDVPF